MPDGVAACGNEVGKGIADNENCNVKKRGSHELIATSRELVSYESREQVANPLPHRSAGVLAGCSAGLWPVAPELSCRGTLHAARIAEIAVQFDGRSGPHQAEADIRSALRTWRELAPATYCHLVIQPVTIVLNLKHTGFRHRIRRLKNFISHVAPCARNLWGAEIVCGSISGLAGPVSYLDAASIRQVAQWTEVELEIVLREPELLRQLFDLRLQLH